MDKMIFENENTAENTSLSDSEFLDLLSEYSPYIESVVSSFPVRHREDLIQEGMVALDSAYRSYNAEKNVPIEAYLKICIKRRIFSAYRMMKKSDETVDIDDNEISDTVDIEYDIVEKKYAEDFFLDLRGKLTDLEKNVLSEYLADKTYQQISEKLGISEKTVDNTLVRIKNKVKKYFTE